MAQLHRSNRDGTAIYDDRDRHRGMNKVPAPDKRRSTVKSVFEFI